MQAVQECLSYKLSSYGTANSNAVDHSRERRSTIDRVSCGGKIGKLILERDGRPSIFLLGK